jgi:uncharacterized membrane protein
VTSKPARNVHPITSGHPLRRDLWLAALAAVGSVVSAYLFVTKAVHATTYCPLGTGCDVVQSSRYAVAFGIPVALLGLAYYAVLLVLGLRRLHRERRWALALPVAGIGVGASIMFTAVQQTAIRATCSLCMLSALLSLGMFIYLVARRPQRPPRATWGWVAVAMLAAIGFLLLGYGASAPQVAANDYATGLAKHLSASGAKFYGAYWCPHCADQKAMFGQAAALLPYIECDPRSPVGRPQVCAAAGVRAYPTWEIKGQRYEGVLSLDELARLSEYAPATP